MKKLFKNQSGFSHHFLLPVLVIVAVSGIGTYVLQRSRAAANVYDDAKTTLVKRQEDPKRGLTYNGLKAVKKNAKHPCAGLFEVQRKNPKDQISCTHGPDPAPAGTDLTDHAAIDQKTSAGIQKLTKDSDAKPPVDERAVKAMPTQTDSSATTAAANWKNYNIYDIASSSRITNKCVGDGTNGTRIVMIYAYMQGHDNYSAVEPVMQKLTQAMQATYAGNSLNAAPAGQVARVLRFKHDASCKPIIFKIKLPTASSHDFYSVSSKLDSIGYNRSDRKYVVWLENPADECGRGTFINDDNSNLFQNRNNLSTGLSVIGKGCWSLGVTLHELEHNFGAVQLSAIHSDGDGHCYQQQDLQCYTSSDQLNTCASDNIGVGLLRVYNLDCADNDYWSANANGGLKNQWNTFLSAWLTTNYR